jgi:Ca2+-binding RTX toxin-like protein
MPITVQNREQVASLYVAMFGRAPDGEGFGFWVNELGNNGKTFAQVADAMYATSPARAYFPSWYTNQEIISSFYTNVLGRTADADGLAFWTAKLNAAGATPGKVIAEMISVVETYSGTDAAGLTSKALFVNKGDVAQAYAEANGSVAGATSILSTVTADAATATAAQNAIKNGTAPGVGGATGQTFTLTTAADGGAAFTGGNANDSFNGVINGVNGTGTTFNPGDNLAGGGGTDKLAVSASGDNNNGGATLTISGFTLDSIERVEISNFDTNTTQTNTHTFDMSGATGVTAVALNGSTVNGDTLFTNLKNLVSAEMTNGGGDLSVGYSSAVTLTGTTDAQGLTVNGVTAGDFTAGNGFEVFNVATTGTKSTLTSLTVGTPTSGTQTLNVTGAVDLAITNALASTVKTVNASAFTGGLTIGLNTGVDTSVTGGSGNDVFNYTTGLSTADTIDGGAGTDILSVTDTLSNAMSNVKNVETLRMGGASKTYDTSKITGLTGFQIADGTSDITVNALGTKSSVTVLGDVTGANTLAQTAASSEITVTLDNSTLKAANGVDVVALTLTNTATLNVVSSGGNLDSTASAANSNSLDLGTTSSLTKIVVSGDTNLSLDNDGTIDATIGAVNSTVRTIDAAAFTGRLYVTASTSASTITGGSGADSITGGTGNDSLVGGAGNDTIASGGGDDNIAGNDGNDSISLGAATAATKVVTVDGGAGNDTITMTSATGYFSLAGGAGDDSFVVSGATSVYFDANDTLAGGDGNDSLTFAGTNGAAFDMSTNAADLANVTGFESVRLDVSGLGTNNHTLSFTFNDVLASNIGNGTLNISAVDAATPSANAGADVTVDASGVLLSSTKVNFTGSAAVQYVYKVGGATDNAVFGAQDDLVQVSNVGYLAAADSLDGGAGSDTLALNYGATSSTAVTLDLTTRTGIKGFETLNLDGVNGNGSGALTVTVSDAFAVANAATSTNTFTIGRTQLGSTTLDDTGTTRITASSVTSTKLGLGGAGGADTIIGGALADTITGNGGNDSLTGGAGNDSFVATASMGIDTITDFDFGTSTTTVDSLNLAARSLSFTSNDFDTVGLVSAGYVADVDVYIFNTASYADVAALDTALETLSTAADGSNKDLILVWQDSLGSVHVSQAVGAAGGGGDAGDEYSVTDLFILSGLTITGVSSLVNIGDFVVA